MTSLDVLCRLEAIYIIRMKFHKNKLLTTGAAVALALAVGACSSSSDDDEMAGTPPPATTDPAPDPTPELTPAQQLAAAEEAVTAAAALVAALTPSSTPEEAAEAYAASGKAQAAVHAATNLPENRITALQARVDQLVLDLDAANMVATQAASVKTALATATTMVDGLTNDSMATDVTAARGAVTAAQAALDATTDLPQDVSDNLGTLITSLDSRLRGIETEVASRPTQAEMAAAVVKTTEAGTKEEAIEEAAEADAGLGGSDDDTLTVEISRDRMGTTVEFTPSDLTEDDDPKFIKQDMNLGEGRSMYVRTKDANDDGDVVEEAVVISTDIAAPRAVAFAKFKDENGMLTQMLTVSSDATNDEDEVTLEALTVTTANAKFVKSPAFTAGGAGTINFPGNAVDANDEDDATRKAGTYNGAEGEYRCTAECTVELDDKGVVIALTNWIFTPDADATSDQRDYDYLHYGFWLEKTTDEDGVLTYDEVATFAGSSIDPSGGVASVTGTATYDDGGATGVYVKNVHTIEGDIESATAGHFTADVSLMATFGQVPVSATDTTGTIAPSLLNTLTGTIDNFDLSGGEAVTWAVNLEGDITENDGTASGSANGGGAAGMFSATFHGPTTDAENDPIQPHTVVGEFGANFSNGSVAGGFGARK